MTRISFAIEWVRSNRSFWIPLWNVLWINIYAFFCFRIKLMFNFSKKMMWFFICNTKFFIKTIFLFLLRFLLLKKLLILLNSTQFVLARFWRTRIKLLRKIQKLFDNFRWFRFKIFAFIHILYLFMKMSENLTKFFFISDLLIIKLDDSFLQDFDVVLD